MAHWWGKLCKVILRIMLVQRLQDSTGLGEHAWRVSLNLSKHFINNWSLLKKVVFSHFPLFIVWKSASHHLLLQQPYQSGHGYHATPPQKNPNHSLQGFHMSTLRQTTSIMFTFLELHLLFAPYGPATMGTAMSLMSTTPSPPLARNISSSHQAVMTHGTTQGLRSSIMICIMNKVKELNV